MAGNETEDEDARFAERFDHLAERELRNLLGPGEHPAKQAERRRVKELLRQGSDDRAVDEARETNRKIQASGGRVSEADVADGPTREQMAQGDFRRVAEVGTGNAREAAIVYRRMSVPTVQRMWAKGQLSDEGFRACRWYCDTYHRAGLDGNIPGVDLQREVFVEPASRSMFSDEQIEAQWELRIVRDALPKRFRKFFEAIVIRDIPPTRAARFAQKRRSEALRIFRDMAETAFSAAEEKGLLD